ncbi:MAG: hypothetical protein RLZZ112_746 [Verrucomicrobiota bacterium]
MRKNVLFYVLLVSGFLFALTSAHAQRTRITTTTTSSSTSTNSTVTLISNK